MTNDDAGKDKAEDKADVEAEAVAMAEVKAVAEDKAVAEVKAVAVAEVKAPAIRRDAAVLLGAMGLLGLAIITLIVMRSSRLDTLGRCDEQQLVRLPDIGPARLADGLGYTYTIAGGRLLWRDARTRTQPVERDIRPLQRVVIFGEDAASARLLVRSDGGGPCGWIARDQLLLRGTGARDYRAGPKPMDGATLRVAGIDVPATDARARVLIPTDTARKAAVVPVAREPGRAADAALPGKPGVASALAAYHVFAHKAVADAVSKSSLHYLLVGGGEGAVRMLGWIDSRDVAMWSSGLMGQWSGTGEGRGFADLASLRGNREPVLKEPPRSPKSASGPAVAYAISETSTGPARPPTGAAKTAGARPAGFHVMLAPALDTPRESVPRPDASTAGPQRMARIYVPATTRSGQSLVHISMVLDEEEIDRFAFVFGLLCENLGRSDGLKYVRNSASMVLNDEGLQSASLAEMLAKAVPVPDRALPADLYEPWGDLDEKLRLSDPDTVLKLRQKSCRTQRLLEGVRRGQALDAADLVWDAERSRLKTAASAPRMFDWRVGSVDGVLLYQVPLGLLNP